MRLATLALSVILGLNSPVRAQAPDTPPLVLAGLDAYRAGGTDSAVAVWLRDSPAQGQPGLSQVIEGLSNIERAYGEFTGYEVLGNVPLGARVIRTYVVILFAGGPLYAWFDSYRTSTGWIMPGPALQYSTSGDSSGVDARTLKSPNMRLLQRARSFKGVDWVVRRGVTVNRSRSAHAATEVARSRSADR
jgi:hypothetical protein